MTKLTQAFAEAHSEAVASAFGGMLSFASQAMVKPGRYLPPEAIEKGVQALKALPSIKKSKIHPAVLAKLVVESWYEVENYLRIFTGEKLMAKGPKPKSPKIPKPTFKAGKLGVKPTAKGKKGY